MRSLRALAMARSSRSDNVQTLLVDADAPAGSRRLDENAAGSATLLTRTCHDRLPKR
jgi:hypothetical protein